MKVVGSYDLHWIPAGVYPSLVGQNDNWLKTDGEVTQVV
jgi:hypothetical protein